MSLFSQLQPVAFPPKNDWCHFIQAHMNSLGDQHKYASVTSWRLTYLVMWSGSVFHRCYRRTFEKTLVVVAAFHASEPADRVGAKRLRRCTKNCHLLVMQPWVSNSSDAVPSYISKNRKLKCTQTFGVPLFVFRPIDCTHVQARNKHLDKSVYNLSESLNGRYFR